MTVADYTADAIEATHGTTWLRGNGCEVICKYLKRTKGVPYIACRLVLLHAEASTPSENSHDGQ